MSELDELTDEGDSDGAHVEADLVEDLAGQDALVLVLVELFDSNVRDRVGLGEDEVGQLLAQGLGQRVAL